MTMKTKILFLSAIIVFCIQAKNNDISYEETCYRYIVPHGPINRPSGSYSCVWNYEITNNSNQNYVTWINRLDSMLVCLKIGKVTSSSIGESGRAILVLQKHGVTDLQEMLSDRHSSKESNPKSHLHIL